MDTLLFRNTEGIEERFVWAVYVQMGTAWSGRPSRSQTSVWGLDPTWLARQPYLQPNPYDLL